MAQIADYKDRLALELGRAQAVAGASMLQPTPSQLSGDLSSNPEPTLHIDHCNTGEASGDKRPVLDAKSKLTSNKLSSFDTVVPVQSSSTTLDNVGSTNGYWMIF